MNMLSVWEADGTRTRILIPLNNIAEAMYNFYISEIGLTATLDNVYFTEIPDVTEKEKISAQEYMNEWRKFNDKRIQLVA